MLRFYGAIAEEERRLISERTKATLTVKEGGWRPASGSPSNIAQPGERRLKRFEAPARQP
jgi:DNA invertase Pin-like site-specific DNA recombinase